VKNYPQSLISIEKQIIVNQQKKRIDIAVYKNEIPFLLIECKNMDVHLHENTLSQSLAYLSSWHAKYLLISNGSQTFGFTKKDNNLVPIFDFPEWSQIDL
jgi:hypothetical protein